jgi:multidrug efflux pump subunit AcrA (membrane-fusion protein)
MKNLLKFGIPLILVLLIAFFVRQQFKVTVLVAPAQVDTALNAVAGTVEVWAFMDINVKAKHRGQLIESPVQAGQMVKEGDVIARQASEDLDLRLEQVEIRLEAAMARVGLESTHKIDLESIDEKLEGVRLSVELGQSPSSTLDNLLRERRKKDVLWKLEEIQQKETTELLQNQLEQLALQSSEMTTKAPFDGTIAALNAFKGDLVNGGQNLVRLISNGRYVLMELTEEDYYGVKDDQEVTLHLASYPDRTFAGTVSRLEDVANSSSKTRNVVVNVDAPDDVLVPGLTGEAFLVKDERPDAVLIPRRALIGASVYVVNNGRVEVRWVQAGYLGLNKAEILSSIEEGDLVVLEDQNLLEEGDSVEVIIRN